MSTRQVHWFIVLLAATLVAPAGATDSEPQKQAAYILSAAGVQGGLVVHLGCGNGKLTAALHANDSFLVHGLDEDVTAARQTIRALGLHGPVSVQKWADNRLPYVDNLVNLVVADDLAKLPASEVLRVLVPGGVALIGGKKTVKPWPKKIDEWTHYLHAPDNNAVARDSVVDIPRSIQWVAEPRWGRSHEELASMSAAVTAQGRIFYIVDEAPLASIRFLGDWKLVARDAFNGTLLWKMPIPSWVDHLRHFRSGPAHLPRRLVAVGDRVYVTPDLAGPVVALDAATGRKACEYQGTERTEEILADNGILYLAVGTSESNRTGGGLFERGEPAPSKFRFITAIDAASAKPLWKKDFAKNEYLLPVTMAVKGSRLYYQSSAGLACLDASTGNETWRTARQTPSQRMGFSSPTLVATDDVILLADLDPEKSPSAGTVAWGVHGWNEPGFPRKSKSTLRAYAAKDGKELWSAPCHEGYNSAVDLFVVDDVVWVGPQFQGLNLKTGEPAKTMNAKAPKVGMPHHRCYRDKATERFILTGKSGIELLSLEEGCWLSNNSWIRGTCQYGILPANGLLYAPPNACACFLTSKVAGFFAAAPQRDKTLHMPFPDKPVLEKGPAYDSPQTAHDSSTDWLAYRHDSRRSGAVASAIPDSVKQQWSTALGGRLTQPVIAGGKVFVARTDAHSVHALDAADGRALWQFAAGGRIDSAPTLYKGRVLFGCADGWIYSVNAADGALAWRFRAAPAERLIEAYGQLESLWPVHGAVLVQNEMLYATAGRSTYLDGGIVLYRLDPVTGQELSKNVLHHLDPDTGKQITEEARFNMEGTTSDILSGDGDRVFLKYFTFDRDGKRTEETKPHPFSITGFLGEEWFVRNYWVVGEGMPAAGWSGWANAANQFPSGQILCFNDHHVYGYGREKVAGGPVGHKADTYRLFSMPQPVAARPAVKKKGAATHDPDWADTQSLIVRAMALGNNRLVVAGPPDLGQKDPDLLAFKNEPEARAGFEGRKGVYLRIVNAEDGKKISDGALPAMPVFDGLSAAGGRLYIATLDGKILCYGDTQ